MLLQSPRYVRMSLVLLTHLVLFVIAYIGAFLLRFDFMVVAPYREVMWGTLWVLLVVKAPVFYAARQYAGWWRYVGLRDVISVTRAAALSTLLFLALNFLFLEHRSFPRSVYLLDFLNTVALISGVRVAVRLVRELLAARAVTQGRGELRRLLIIGAGDTGETLLREINKNRNLLYEPVAILDDDPRKQGLRIHNVPVLGPVSEAARVVRELEVHEIIIAAPSATREQLRGIYDKLQETKIKPRILPAVENVLEGHISLNEIREVAIEDLLGRQEVKLDQKSIASYLRGKVVLVTGAGGSIGSEICRQVCRFGPQQLLLVEQAENPLFFIERELRRQYAEGNIDLHPVIADICDEQRIEQIFARWKPDVVLHAAAHKHVPLMEANPGEAVRNNFGGTRNVARASHRHGVRNFVMISTDKAINPTSVMGTTKRLAELYVQAMATQSRTRFIAVRFGNVLGSNGSVVPIFREQIRRGGPVTVTHPDMTRYFMTIPEATQLVLQAATVGESGQVFVLDMGEPVKIVDLARDLIRLSGFAPGEEIDIVFTGPRPGEKLFEELSLDKENIRKTSHEKIFIGDVAQLPLETLEVEAEAMGQLIAQGASRTVIKTHLKRLVPEYAYEPPDEDSPAALETSGKLIPLRPRDAAEG
jgi:FlaA1/EpsC-like NDP-sugar epimerase